MWNKMSGIAYQIDHGLYQDTGGAFVFVPRPPDDPVIEIDPPPPPPFLEEFRETPRASFIPEEDEPPKRKKRKWFYSSKAWRNLADACRARDGDTCRDCGKWGRDVHHVIARAAGGEDALENLITLCADCHADRHPNLPSRGFVNRSYA